MIIGSVSENKEIEKRISITTDLVKKYISSGFEILLEEGFGKHLGILDDEKPKEPERELEEWEKWEEVSDPNTGDVYYYHIER